jgi:hypothetical protein
LLPGLEPDCRQAGSLLVRPEPLLIKDIKVQVNKQKPSNVFQPEPMPGFAIC